MCRGLDCPLGGLPHCQEKISSCTPRALSAATFKGVSVVDALVSGSVKDDSSEPVAATTLWCPITSNKQDDIGNTHKAGGRTSKVCTRRSKPVGSCLTLLFGPFSGTSRVRSQSYRRLHTHRDFSCIHSLGGWEKFRMTTLFVSYNMSLPLPRLSRTSTMNTGIRYVCRAHVCLTVPKIIVHLNILCRRRHCRYYR